MAMLIRSLGGLRTTDAKLGEIKNAGAIDAVDFKNFRREKPMTLTFLKNEHSKLVRTIR